MLYLYEGDLYGDTRSRIAGVIYIASAKSDERITQKEIADSADISEITVRNTYKKIIKAFDDDPLDIVDE